jgi:predicted ArsR family transcriptional regulator
LKARLITGKHYPDRRSSIEEPEPAMLHRTSAFTRVLECLKEAPSTVSINDIARATKLSTTAVSTTLIELVHRGLAERTNDAPPFLFRAK